MPCGTETDEGADTAAAAGRVRTLCWPGGLTLGDAARGVSEDVETEDEEDGPVGGRKPSWTCWRTPFVEIGVADTPAPPEVERKATLFRIASARARKIIE